MAARVVGISLKMYFTHARTRAYAAALREVADADEGVSTGRTELVLLPSFPSIPAVLAALAGSPVRVGAQDLCSEDVGAFTGEVSGAELAELGCTHVEIGHAERRTLFGESEALVRAKTSAAWRNGLTPLLCAGERVETDPETAAGVVVGEVRSALADARAAGLSGRLIVAYEPHWAIGQPRPASAAHVSSVCRSVRGALAAELAGVAIVYGGSAGPGLLTQLADSVDGLFLGRFAHDPEAVRRVLREAATL